MSLEIVRLFGVATLQGSAQPGRRRFGVPAGGAFDRESLALSNALAGCSEGNSVWELGMANVIFRATQAGTVSVVGAPAAVTVDGRGVPSQSAFPVGAGSEIHIGPPSRAARVYVAFGRSSAGRLRRLAAEPMSLNPVLRFVLGPQASHFGRLGGKSFQVGTASDRVGIRLEGAFEPHEVELPSEPACSGTVQVTGSGGLLLLGPDGPTIGGYPKVAVVIVADLDRVGQLRPGEQVAFVEVSLEEARRLRGERLQRIERQCAQIRAAVAF